MKRVVFFAFCVFRLGLGGTTAFPFPEEYVRRYLAAAGGPVLPEQPVLPVINPSQVQATAFANQYNNVYSQPLYPSLHNSDIGAGNYYPPIENMGMNLNVPGEEFNEDAFAMAQAQSHALINDQSASQANAQARAQANAQARVKAIAQANARARAQAIVEASAKANAQARAQARAQAIAQANAQANAETRAQALVQTSAQANPQANVQLINTYPHLSDVAIENHSLNPNQWNRKWEQEFYNNQLQKNIQHVNNIHASEFNINKNAFQEINSLQNKQNPQVSQSYVSPLNAKPLINSQPKLNHNNIINTSGKQNFNQLSSQSSGSTSSIVKRNQNIDSMINNKRIQNIVSKTQLKKRYLVVHPDGKVEHVDTLDNVIKNNPNYVLINSGRFKQSTAKSEIKSSSPINNPSNLVEQVKPQDIKKFSVTEITSSTKNNAAVLPGNNKINILKAIETKQINKNTTNMIENNNLKIKQSNIPKLIEILKNDNDKKKSKQNSVVKNSVKTNKSADNVSKSAAAGVNVKIENKKEIKKVELNSKNKIQKKTSVKFSIKTTPKPPTQSKTNVNNNNKKSFKKNKVISVSAATTKISPKTIEKSTSTDKSNSLSSAISAIATAINNINKENQVKKSLENEIQNVKNNVDSTKLKTKLNSSISIKEKNTNTKRDSETEQVLHVIPVQNTKKTKTDILSIQNSKKPHTSEIKNKSKNLQSASSVVKVKANNTLVNKSSTKINNKPNKSTSIKSSKSSTHNKTATKSTLENSKKSDQKIVVNKSTSATTIINNQIKTSSAGKKSTLEINKNVKYPEKVSKEESKSLNELETIIDGATVKKMIKNLTSKENNTAAEQLSNGRMTINAFDSNDKEAAKILQMFKGLSKEEIKDKVLILLVMPPIIDRDYHSTIYPDGTVIDEITETTWDSEDEYAEPKVVTTTKVRHLNDPPSNEFE